jgi:hypothetical protein
MDDDTRGYLEAMKARLMGRLNNAQEAIIERLRVLEASIAALSEVARSTNTTMSLIVSLLTNDGPNPAGEA